jgi:hypothetical protein
VKKWSQAFAFKCNLYRYVAEARAADIVAAATAVDNKKLSQLENQSADQRWGGAR